MTKWAAEKYAILKMNDVSMQRFADTVGVSRQRLYTILHSECPSEKAKNKVDTALKNIVGEM